MSRSIATVLFLTILVNAASAGADERLWREWEQKLHRQCPSHHVEWLADGSYDSVIDRFFQSLPPMMRQRAITLADIPGECAKVTGGFGCEMEGALKAFREMRLTGRFVSFLCRNYRCQRVSECSGPFDR